MSRSKGVSRRANARPSAAAARRFTPGIEMLEPRAVLSGISPAILPPPPTDGTVIGLPPAPAVSGLRIMLPPAVANGVPTIVVIEAIDAAGRPVPGSSGSLNLTSSDAAATLPATAMLVNGRAAVMVTFRTAGPQTITTTDAVAPSITATASTTVAEARVATRLNVLVPPQARADETTPVVVVAVDAAGRPVPTFSGSATVTSSDPAAGLPLVPVFFQDGRATFPVTFTTAGRQSVTITSLGDVPIAGTGSTVVVVPQSLAAFAIQMPPRVTAGTPVGVTILALDGSKRPLPGYSGTATLASSDPAATLPTTITFVGGRAQARVTFATAGRQTLTVRGGAAGDVSAVASTLVVATPVTTRFAIMLPRAVAVGVPVPLVIVAVDAQGRPVLNFTGTAALSSSDSAAAVPATVKFVNGRALARVTFATLGEQTITASSGTLTGSGTTLVGEVAVNPVVA